MKNGLLNFSTSVCIHLVHWFLGKNFKTCWRSKTIKYLQKRETLLYFVHARVVFQSTHFVLFEKFVIFCTATNNSNWIILLKTESKTSIQMFADIKQVGLWGCFPPWSVRYWIALYPTLFAPTPRGCSGKR